MEKIDQDLNYDFKYVRLSFQDVKDIYKVIEEFDDAQQNHSDISIEIGGYKLSDVEELYNLSDSSYDSIKISYYNLIAGNSIFFIT